MKKWYFFPAAAAMFIFWGISAFAGGTMWVASENAALKSEPKASSKTLSTLPVGSEVSVLASEKRWYHIKTTSGKKDGCIAADFPMPPL